MIQRKEKLILDVYDHDDNKLCNLYDNKSQLTGQAENVVQMKQRNGWKEQSFDLTGKVRTNEGMEDNWRTPYIVADYKIRLEDEDGVDWYLMTEPQIKHTNGIKTMSVKAGHVCQLLKTKNLALEFSDDEGNNTGTLEELANTILEGTGWSVGDCDEFYEDFRDNAGNQIVKKRSLVAQAKTGAFSQISKACDLFRAKPVYHGDTKTIDFKPLNPFSENIDGSVPDAVTEDDIFEMHYGHSVKGITRTLNTENLVTRLYVQGAYGDKVSGYCGINEVEHYIYTYTFKPSSGNTGFPAGQEFRISFKDDTNKKNYRYFVVEDAIDGNATFDFNLRDPASMLFVTGSYGVVTDGDYVSATSGAVIHVTKKSVTGSYVSAKSSKKSKQKSRMSSLMDFTYYDSVGLINQARLEKIAQYYREAPDLLEQVETATNEYNEALSQLTETIGVVDFCKLNIASVDGNGDYPKLVLGPDNGKGNGVIYRTDYDKKANQRFKWREAKKLKSNGDPAEDVTASVVYILHPKQTNKPITWDKCYIKELHNDNVLKIVGTWERSGLYNDRVIMSPYDGEDFLIVASGNQMEVQDNITDPATNKKYYPRTSAYGNDPFGDFGHTDVELSDYNEDYKTTCRLVVHSNGYFSVYFDYNSDSKKTTIDQENISAITLWTPSSDISIDASNDQIFLFQTYNLNGSLGALEASDEATVQSLEAALKVITAKHPVYFKLPSQFNDSTLSQDEIDALNGYGWTWVYSRTDREKGTLYFCYPTENDTKWQRVWYSNGDLYANGNYISPRDYWYQWQERKLYRCYETQGGSRHWVWLESNDEKKIAELFGTIYNSCWTRDQYYKGIYDETVYTVGAGETLSKGNYAMYGGFHKYWLFTTQRNLSEGDRLIYDRKLDVINEYKGNVKKVLEVKSIRGDAATYHPENLLKDATWEDNTINPSTGEDKEDNTCKRTGFIQIQPKTHYTLNIGGANSPNIIVAQYNENREFIRKTTTTTGFTTSAYTKEVTVAEETIQVEMLPKYIRIAYKTGTLTSIKATADNWDSTLILQDEVYKIIGKDSDANHISYPETTTDDKPNECKGIMYLIYKFRNYANSVYQTYQPAVEAAQAAVTDLENQLKEAMGDMYREGYWEDDNYTEGDEQRLYNDGLDNLAEIAKPEAKYKVDFLNLRSSQVDDAYWSADCIKRGVWPRITIDSAVHLIDADIDINTWAFVDKVTECYDQPWRTTVDINTDLSTISQHTFADVMTNIADVASKVKAKQSVYERASAIGKGGVLDSNFLEGKISANKLLIEGGNSTWRTDTRGNMIFENVDGGSAMTLTGNGFAIANSKDEDGDWNWRTFGTGEGFTADLITAGTLNAANINVTNLNADNITTGTLNGTILRPGTISSTKFDAPTKDKLDKIGDVSGLSDTMVNMISDARGLAQTAQTLANTKNTTYIESTDPHDNPEITLKKGDTWIDTGHQNIMKKWNGTTWIEQSDSASAQALELATTAYTASSNINKITYSIDTPQTGKSGDIWVCTNTSNNYHNMYICQEDYQSNTNTQPDYIAPENRLSKWTLTSSGKLYGTAMNINTETGHIGITAASTIDIASNDGLTIQSGQVSIGANSSVNIASNGSINMNTAQGSINLTSGNVNLNGATIGMTGGTINATAGTINVAGATLNVAADDIDIGSSDIGEEDWSRNLIFNSAANAMRYTYTPVTTQGSESITKTIDWTSSGWGSNSAQSVGKAQDMINSITTEPSDYKNPFKNKKNVFKLTPTNSGNHYAWNQMSQNERIVEPGKYTAQIRFFATQSLINSLGTSLIDNYIGFFQQYGNNMQSFFMCGFKSLSNNNNADYKVVKPGWNKWKRTFTITDDMLTQTNIRLYFWLKSGITLPILFTNVKLERGATATAWTAAPEDDEENYQLGQDLSISNWTKFIQNSNTIGLQASRITKITGSDGQAYANRVVNSSLTLDPTKMNVAFNGKTAMNITNTETKINTDTLKVSGHISGDVVNSQGSASYTINSSSHSSETDTKLLQMWINSLGKYLTGTISITIGKKVKGNIVQDGFKCDNGGKIQINFSSGGYLFGTIYGRQCDHIVVKGTKGSSNVADIFTCGIVPIGNGVMGITMYGVQYFECSDITVDLSESSSTGNKVAYRLAEGTHAIFDDCCALGSDMPGSVYGWYAIYCANVWQNNCFGGQDEYTGSAMTNFIDKYKLKSKAIYSYYGSSVYVNRKKPFGGTASYGGSISVEGAATETAGMTQGNGIVYDITSYETITASPRQNTYYGYSQASISSSISNSNTANMKQRVAGRVMCGPVITTTETSNAISATTTYYYGIWLFGSGSNNTIKGNSDLLLSNVTSASQMLARKSTLGSDNGNTVSVYWTTRETNAVPDASSTTTQSYYFDSSHKIGDLNIEMGELGAIALTGTHLTALRNGQIKGFCVASSYPMEFNAQVCDLTMQWEV